MYFHCLKVDTKTALIDLLVLYSSNPGHTGFHFPFWMIICLVIILYVSNSYELYFDFSVAVSLCDCK